jgi:AAA domain
LLRAHLPVSVQLGADQIIKALGQSENGNKPYLRSKVLVITGGPGLGKTMIFNAILRILAAKKRFSGWFGLFRFWCPCIGAEQMAKRRQNLYMVAYNFRNCQQRSRE